MVHALMKTKAAAALALVISGTLLAPTVQARAARDHVCPADRPDGPPVPPPVVLPPGAGSAAGEAAEPASVGPDPAPPSLTMGCVSRKHPLRKTEVAGAQEAVALAEAPGSAAAIFRFTSIAGRREQTATWLAASRPVSDASEPAPPPAPLTLYINGWENTRWSLPGQRVVHAMYPEDAASGKLCLVRADLAGAPEALAALNNWCMDRLDLWAD